MNTDTQEFSYDQDEKNRGKQVVHLHHIHQKENLVQVLQFHALVLFAMRD